MRIDKIEFERNTYPMDFCIQENLRQTSLFDVSDENDFTHSWWENSIFLDEHNFRLASTIEMSDFFNDVVTGNHPPVCKGPAVLEEDESCWTFPSLKIEKYTFEDLIKWQETHHDPLKFTKLIIRGETKSILKDLKYVSSYPIRKSGMIPQTIIICDGSFGKIRRRIRNVGPGQRILMSEMVCTGSPTVKLFREEWE